MIVSSATDPNISYPSDEGLLIGLQKGDRTALKHIYKECWPMVAGFVRQNNGNEVEAEDVFQDAIIVLYEKAKDTSFHLTCSIKTYVYSVCRNKWLKHLRGTTSLTIIDSYADSIAEDLPEENIYQTFSDELTDAVRSLGEPCQKLLLGYYFERLSLEQLALQLDYASPNVAKQRKFKCLERLKKLFSHQKASHTS